MMRILPFAVSDKVVLRDSSPMMHFGGDRCQDIKHGLVYCVEEVAASNPPLIYLTGTAIAPAKRVWLPARYFRRVGAVAKTPRKRGDR